MPVPILQLRRIAKTPLTPESPNASAQANFYMTKRYTVQIGALLITSNTHISIPCLRWSEGPTLYLGHIRPKVLSLFFGFPQHVPTEL